VGELDNMPIGKTLGTASVSMDQDCSTTVQGRNKSLRILVNQVEAGHSCDGRLNYLSVHPYTYHAPLTVVGDAILYMGSG
jgi:hypothetical protein